MISNQFGFFFPISVGSYRIYDFTGKTSSLKVSLRIEVIPFLFSFLDLFSKQNRAQRGVFIFMFLVLMKIASLI